MLSLVRKQILFLLCVAAASLSLIFFALPQLTHAQFVVGDVVKPTQNVSVFDRPWLNECGTGLGTVNTTHKGTVTVGQRTNIQCPGGTRTMVGVRWDHGISGWTRVDMLTKVANNQAPTLTFTINGNSSEVNVASGAAITLRWQSNTGGCTAASNPAGGWSGNKPASGSYEGHPEISRVYAITCTGANKMAVTKSVKVKVNQTVSADREAPSVPGNLRTTEVNYTDAKIVWSASTDNVAVSGYQLQSCEAVNCTNFANIALPKAVGTVQNPVVVQNLKPGQTYRFRVRAFDGEGNNSGWSNVLQITTGGNNQTGTPNLTFTINNNASGVEIVAGTAATLRWQSNAQRCEASSNPDGGWNGVKDPSGEYTGHPAEARTYTISCYSASGAKASKSVTVRMRASSSPAPTITSFTATPTTVQSGGRSTLRWQTQGATQCYARSNAPERVNTWSRVVGPSGTEEVTITGSGSVTLYLRCVSSAGIDSDTEEKVLITAEGNSNVPIPNPGTIPDTQNACDYLAMPSGLSGWISRSAAGNAVSASCSANGAVTVTGGIANNRDIAIYSAVYWYNGSSWATVNLSGGTGWKQGTVGTATFTPPRPLLQNGLYIAAAAWKPEWGNYRWVLVPIRMNSSSIISPPL